MLIFRSSHSQMVFKIGVLKNIHRNASVLALAGLRLKNIYGGCISIFEAANSFFIWIWYFTLCIYCTDFCSELLWKHELNVRRGHGNSSAKKGLLRKFYRKTPVLKTLFNKVGLPILITYTSGSNWCLCFTFCIIIYSLVCQFSFYCYWYCYNEKWPPGGVVRKRFLTNFAKLLQKTPALKTCFHEGADLQSLTLS